MEALGGLYLFAVLAVTALVIAWILLPFALFGTKPILREIRDELRALNARLGAKSQQAVWEEQGREMTRHQQRTTR